jgi:DNA helicase-2/ATP-dependent DNA helicase PcrA
MQMPNISELILYFLAFISTYVQVVFLLTFLEKRRIAYVAMTRARNELIFTCPKQLTLGQRSRTTSPSAFFAEAGDLPESEKELKNPAQAATLMFTPMRNMDEEYKTFLRRKLKDFSISVTALNHFLEDPKIFEASDLLQVPQSKDASLVYGNAVHDALRKWALKLKEGTVMDEKEFMMTFTTYLEEREVLTPAERARLIKLGEESLPRYFAERIEGSNPIIAHVELPVSALLGDVPIKGKLDRIDLLSPDSSKVRVIDYKTGRPKTESQIRDEDYYRQLTFYALLLRHGKSIYEPESFTLDFIGESGEHPIERTFQITEAEEKDLTKVIDAVWTKVINLDFTPL